MGWIGVLVDVILRILKALFGLDKPKDEEVIDAPNPLPRPHVDDVLDDLGVPHPRADGKD